MNEVLEAMYKATDTEAGISDSYVLYDYSGPFARPIEVANHYGFHLVKPLDASYAASDERYYFDDTYKKACGTRGGALLAGNTDLICHTQNPRRKQGSLILEAHGCSRSIAEGIILKAALSILREEGEKHAELEINSLGDTEAQARFKKHYLDFLKKHLTKIPEEYQASVRDNPFFASELALRDENLKDVFSDAPGPLNYLGDHDRRHLKEVIEYIESIGIPYKLNSSLLGHEQSPSHSFFRIVRTPQGKKKTEEEPTVLAAGERFEYRGSARGQRHAIVSLSVRLNGGKYESYKEKKAGHTPKLYFVHLGPEAKKKGFVVLDILRETKLPVSQNLIRDSLTEQMNQAEASCCSHLIIMGIKEAQENSVIVRDTATRAQATVEIPRLRSYLRTIVK